MKNPYFNLLKTSIKFSGKNKLRLLLVYFIFTISNITIRLEPLVFGKLLNTIQEGGPNMIKNSLFYLTIFTLITLIFWLFHGPGRVLERTIAFDTIKNFKEKLYSNIINFPLKWHQNHHTGDTISRFNKASEALETFSNEVFMHMDTIIKFIVSLIAIMIFTPLSGIISLVIGIFSIFIMLKFDKVLIKLLDERNEKRHISSSFLHDYISNINTVITLRLQKLTQKEYIKKILDIWPVFKKHIKINELKWFTVSMIMASINFVVLFTYIYKETSLGNTILIGTLVMLYQYTQQFINVFYDFAWKYEQITYNNTDLNTIKSIFDFSNSINSSKTSFKKINDFKKIEIKNLNFKYEDNKHHTHTLKNINLEINKGEKIAFVGESGSGKTTTMTIIRGLYEPDEINIFADSKKINLKSLSQITTLIPQEPEIFENTIKYNITIGISHTKKEIMQACKIAQFDGILKKLPHGLDSNIREKGVNLSGGEKQRLALARGVFAAEDSEIILLDEPTSSVDSANELQIHKNLFSHFKDKSIISSIHRLHLLPLFDTIYVFDKGQMIESGNYNELIKNKKSRLSKIISKYKNIQNEK